MHTIFLHLADLLLVCDLPRNLLAFEILQGLLEKHAEDDVRQCLTTIYFETLKGKADGSSPSVATLTADNAMRIVSLARAAMLSGKDSSRNLSGVPVLDAITGGDGSKPKGSRFARKPSLGA